MQADFIVQKLGTITNRLAYGCGKCTFDESDGELVLHCAECQLSIVRDSHDLYIGAGPALLLALTKAVRIAKSAEEPKATENGYIQVNVTLVGRQGAGKSLLASKLKTFLEWLGVTDVNIRERLP